MDIQETDTVDIGALMRRMASLEHDLELFKGRDAIAM